MVVLWFGARLVLDGRMTAGRLSAFVVYAVFVAANAGSLMAVFSQVMQVDARRLPQQMRWGFRCRGLCRNKDLPQGLCCGPVFGWPAGGTRSQGWTDGRLWMRVPCMLAGDAPCLPTVEVPASPSIQNEPTPRVIQPTPGPGRQRARVPAAGQTAPDGHERGAAAPG
jgi:ABC-type multidrug transport system fused ATPase/permease subunit